VLQALGSALAAAGVTAYRVTGKAPTIQKALQNLPPATIIVTRAAADNTFTARRRSGNAPVVRTLADGTDAATGGVFDLRPWSGSYVTLSDNPLA
jgi:hypothetical protein